jgi:hypothetical protein
MEGYGMVSSGLEQVLVVAFVNNVINLQVPQNDENF